MYPAMDRAWFEERVPFPADGGEYSFGINADLDHRPSLILSRRIDSNLGERQIIAERFFYSSRSIPAAIRKNKKTAEEGIDPLQPFSMKSGPVARFRRPLLI